MKIISQTREKDHHPVLSMRIGKKGAKSGRELLRSSYIIVAGILLSVLVSDCSGSLEKVNFQPEESAAYFDYFTYTGNDDFYNENPRERLICPAFIPLNHC